MVRRSSLPYVDRLALMMYIQWGFPIRPVSTTTIGDEHPIRRSFVRILPGFFYSIVVLMNL